MNNLKQLSPPEIKVAAKELILNGYTTRKVEEILGIDHSTAARYAEAPIEEEQQQFATVFDAYIKDQKAKGINIVYKRLLELVPKERRIDQVVKAGEFLEGKSNKGIEVQVNNQVNSIEFYTDEDKTPPETTGSSGGQTPV